MQRRRLLSPQAGPGPRIFATIVSGGVTSWLGSFPSRAIFVLLSIARRRGLHILGGFLQSKSVSWLNQGELRGSSGGGSTLGDVNSKWELHELRKIPGCNAHATLVRDRRGYSTSQYKSICPLLVKCGSTDSAILDIVQIWSKQNNNTYPIASYDFVQSLASAIFSPEARGHSDKNPHK